MRHGYVDVCVYDEFRLKEQRDTDTQQQCVRRRVCELNYRAPRARASVSSTASTPALSKPTSSRVTEFVLNCSPISADGRPACRIDWRPKDLELESYMLAWCGSAVAKNLHLRYEGYVRDRRLSLISGPRT
ncbi:hypothetical protein EVAR_17724_1 [Eumeta japonica]|uniref:Uncharacterized protein n=1 Tax=Eumeta variegata TaxID=151549 RepID=A0A4C1UT71_EUMVA|nr:hypothetical protein EVAR_17724_1 [Eumeta japonica]